MALLFNGVIDTEGARQNLCSLGSFYFVADTVYTIQVIGSSCVIGSDADNGGFVIDNSIPFTYNSDGSDLYIKTNGKISINIEG